MSAQPVDVLAVLDSLIEYHDTSDSLKGRNCIAARAAVAELIEASNRARSILALHDDGCPQLDAALARVGGAA